MSLQLHHHKHVRWVADMAFFEEMKKRRFVLYCDCGDTLEMPATEIQNRHEKTAFVRVSAGLRKKGTP